MTSVHYSLKIACRRAVAETASGQRLYIVHENPLPSGESKAIRLKRTPLTCTGSRTKGSRLRVANKPSRNTLNRLLVVSDIHGHKTGLLALLEAAAYDPSADKLMLLGDYIDADKPASWDTLDLVRALVEGGARAIPGNQELKLASMLRRRGAAYRKYADWIMTLPLYLKSAHYLLVHAGIRPGRALHNQSARDLTEIREEFYKASAERLPGNRRIVFGHTPTFKLGAQAGEIWSDARRIGIDTGAKHGMRLTLLNLSGLVAYSCKTMPGYASDGEVRIEPVDDILGHASGG